MSKYLYFDSEYSDKAEKNLQPVCHAVILSTSPEKSIVKWTAQGSHKSSQDFFVKAREKEYTLVAFSVLAEARYLMSLGINPLKFNWIDLKVEYEQALNSNYELEYGNQLDGSGNIIFTTPPKNKYDMTEEEEIEHGSSKKAKRSLLSALYKILGVHETGDIEYKNKMRDICIRYDLIELSLNKQDIMEYCLEDTIYLPQLHQGINSQLLSKISITRDQLEKVQILRGNYVAHAAVRASRGYPVNYEALKNVSDSIEDIVKDLQEDITSQFKSPKIFVWDKKANRYKVNQKGIKQYIRDLKPDWPTTDKGHVSLASKSFKDYRDYKYNYPRGDFFAQYSRYLSFNTSLNGIRKKANPKPSDQTIFDSIGSDNRCRPYAPPFNSQTSRTYPKATSFIPAKAAWMRSLIQPPKGSACFGIDYSSQEFLLNAIESIDENMFQAYVSGDPYIWLAIKANEAPEGATKESHATIRDIFKTLTLAIGFGMGSKSLAKQLSQVSGKKWSEFEANSLIETYYEIYSEYAEWRYQTAQRYRMDGYLMLRDGWALLGDNPNMNSVLNLPFQGGAASIMRLSEVKAVKNGVKPIYTLHDALYGQDSFSSFEQSIKKLYGSMKWGFIHYYSQDFLDETGLCTEFDYNPRQEEMAKAIRLDVNAWGHDVTSGNIGSIRYKGEEVYIDPRAKKDYEFFKKYF